MQPLLKKVASPPSFPREHENANCTVDLFYLNHEKSMLCLYKSPMAFNEMRDIENVLQCIVNNSGGVSNDLKKIENNAAAALVAA